MTREVFNVEWDLWKGLFPSAGRNPAAYYAVLQHMTDGAFRRASRAAIQGCKHFPSVGELMAQVAPSTRSWAPANPIGEATTEQLRRDYARLEGIYYFAQDRADSVGVPGGSTPAPHLKYTVHRVLQKLVAINAEALASEYHKRRK